MAPSERRKSEEEWDRQRLELNAGDPQTVLVAAMLKTKPEELRSLTYKDVFLRLMQTAGGIMKALTSKQVSGTIAGREMSGDRCTLRIAVPGGEIPMVLLREQGRWYVSGGALSANLSGPGPAPGAGPSGIGVAARERPLDEWVREIPDADALRKRIREGLSRLAKEQYWRLGNEIHDLARGRLYEQFMPAFLAELNASQGRDAAALLHAVKTTSIVIRTERWDAFSDLHALASDAAARFVTERDGQIRVAAAALLAHLADEAVTITAPRERVGVRERAIRVIREACQGAVLDDNKEVRYHAQTALKSLGH
jgi:hypothetical protein